MRASEGRRFNGRKRRRRRNSIRWAGSVRRQNPSGFCGTTPETQPRTRAEKREQIRIVALLHRQISCWTSRWTSRWTPPTYLQSRERANVNHVLHVQDMSAQSNADLDWRIASGSADPKTSIVRAHPTGASRAWSGTRRWMSTGTRLGRPGEQSNSTELERLVTAVRNAQLAYEPPKVGFPLLRLLLLRGEREEGRKRRKEADTTRKGRGGGKTVEHIEDFPLDKYLSKEELSQVTPIALRPTWRKKDGSRSCATSSRVQAI